MLDTDCLAALPTQSNIVFGASPFGITASEIIPGGYSTPICYKCTITPIGGLGAIMFTKQITIIALPLDCSSSLSDAGFTYPAIPYNSVGTSV